MAASKQSRKARKRAVKPVKPRRAVLPVKPRKRVV
jgi:hypothetical protein